MSFSDDIVIADATPADVTYSIISLVGGKSIRSDAARELGTPRSLTVAHQSTGANLSARDRHLVRLDRIEADTDTDNVAVLSGSVYMVIEHPRRVITKVHVSDMITQMINFMTTANIAKILNSEP